MAYPYVRGHGRGHTGDGLSRSAPSRCANTAFGWSGLRPCLRHHGQGVDVSGAAVPDSRRPGIDAAVYQVETIAKPAPAGHVWGRAWAVFDREIGRGATRSGIHSATRRSRRRGGRRQPRNRPSNLHVDRLAAAGRQSARPDDWRPCRGTQPLRLDGQRCRDPHPVGAGPCPTAGSGDLAPAIYRGDRRRTCRETARHCGRRRDGGAACANTFEGQHRNRQELGGLPPAASERVGDPAHPRRRQSSPMVSQPSVLRRHVDAWRAANRGPALAGYYVGKHPCRQEQRYQHADAKPGIVHQMRDSRV